MVWSKFVARLILVSKALKIREGHSVTHLLHSTFREGVLTMLVVF